MPDVPLRPTTIRFSEDGFDLIQRAADTVGAQFSQFVREAALMRSVIVLQEELGLKHLDEMVRMLSRSEEAPDA